MWIGAAVGCGIGVVDEGIKVLLPGREFSTGDLVRDFIDVFCAYLIIAIIIVKKKNRVVKMGKGD